MAQATQQGTSPGGRQDTLPRWMWLIGIAGPILFWLVVLVFGAVKPGYSAVAEGISALGAVGAEYAIVQRINFVLLGGSILAFAFGLDRRFREGWRPWLCVVLIGLFGVGVIGAGVFQSNPANRASMTEMLHGLFSIVGFFAGLFGVPLTTWRLAQHDRWSSYQSRKVVVGVTVLVVGAFVLFLFLGINETGFHGLGQRLFAGILSGWVVYRAVKLYRRSD